MAQAGAMRVLGMMSGTSADGVDAAILDTDGERALGFGPTAYAPYSGAERARLRAAMAQAAADPTRDFSDIARLVADRHEDAARRVLAQLGPGEPTPSLVGFHGQTLHHAPERGRTLQVGDAAGLATRLGLAVVADFRSADMAAGGQGAPLAPFYHFALAKSAGATAPLAVLNLGGVGNVTWIDPRADRPDAPGALLAFDTGPANALVDDLVFEATGAAFDQDGALARQGQVDAALLAKWLGGCAYFSAPPPKSLDRDAMAFALDAVRGAALEDAVATLMAFSAEAVAAAERFLPTPPSRWLLTGGGRRNPALVDALAARLSAPVLPIERLADGASPSAGDPAFAGATLDGDMLEAQAFAHLAARSVRGLPLSAPGSTGAPRPICGGQRFDP